MKLKFLLYAALLISLVIGSVFSSPLAVAGKPALKVTFLSPSPADCYPFWDDYISFMRVAAQSLGIELTVIEGQGRYDVVDNARAVLEGASRPDYLTYIYQAENTRDVLDMAEKAGVKSIIINTDVFPRERLFAGFPRQKFDHWIGHILPDDAMAGTLLAEHLVKAWREREGARPGEVVHVIGLGGNLDATASVYRENGLRVYAERRPGVTLDRYVLSNWDKDIAYEKSIRLMKIYPKAAVYWAANDQIAAGVLKAAREVGRRPGVDLVTGGIDWSAEGIEAVRNGEMEVTLGGHFMEGAWALVMAYDYQNGNDFDKLGLVQRSEMRAIDKGNIDTYLSLLDRGNWEKIDFKRFTRTHNPEIKAYEFNPDAVLRELGRRP